MSERLIGLIAENRARFSKLPFSRSLLTPGGGVNLYTNLEDLQLGSAAKVNVLSNAIPGWSVGTERYSDNASIFLLEHAERAFYYDTETRTAFFLGKREDFADGQVLGWIGYWMMEAQRQERSFFTLHSSALTVGEKGILLLGHSGSGKTSVMLDLCRKYDGEVVSNDLTIVKHGRSSGQLELVDGTREIRLRLASVLKNFPEFVGLFPVQIESAWETKTTVMPEQVGLRSSIYPRTLDAIFEIHLDSMGKDPLIVRRENGVPLHYRLYEDMSRIVRGSAVSVFSSDANFLGYLPSLDTVSMHANRVDCINQIVKKTGITSISGGNLDRISETIYSLVTKS